MQSNFALRSRVAMAIRNYLVSEGFLEIETPFMTRSTPEGARDYLVPSRIHAGSFYALPQSPQIFKQILMVSGFDRYFQIARCFRDEDLRADRQPEFTQIDLEMSFPQMDTIFRVTEGFLTAAFAAAGIALAPPFVRMTYDEAIRNYGIDKPDMRLPQMTDLTSVLSPSLREKLKIEQKLPILGFAIPFVSGLSETARKALLAEIRNGFGDCGLDVLDVARLAGPKASEEFKSLAENIYLQFVAEYEKVFLDFPNPNPGQVFSSAMEFMNNSLPIVVTPKLGTPATWNYDPQWIWKRVGALRLDLAKKFADKHKLLDPSGPNGTYTAADFKFAWVTDFPMYEWNEESKTWDAAHHPFTSPHEDDIQAGRLTNDKGAVRALAYDVVLNGTELGSGSIRIHRKDVQAEIFRSLGMTDEEAQARFGFFLQALEYGTPPHGGIALGLDRIVMILAGATSLREVIAFPKTARAIDLMVDAPTPVSDLQLRDLHLRIATRS
jgi:aspartyl-tRNA synthetase